MAVVLSLLLFGPGGMEEEETVVEARVDEEGVGVAYFWWRAERKLRGWSEGREGRIKDAGLGSEERPYDRCVRIWRFWGCGENCL